MNAISDNQTVLIQIVNIKDAAGNTTTFQSVPVWSESPAILALTVASDGMSATGVATAAGTAVVTVTADGVTETVSIPVAAGQAVSFQLTVTVVAPAPVVAPPAPAAPVVPAVS